MRELIRNPLIEAFPFSGGIDSGLLMDSGGSEFDETCLSPIKELIPTDIKAIREKEHLSQGVLARYLNVSKNQISEWERGKKKTSGTAVKLLTLVKERGIEAIA